MSIHFEKLNEKSSVFLNVNVVVLKSGRQNCSFSSKKNRGNIDRKIRISCDQIPQNYKTRPIRGTAGA